MDWSAVRALFDANFVFRRSESEPGDRWYRKDANGAQIWVKERGGAVLVGVQQEFTSIPDGITAVGDGVFADTQLHGYRVDSMAGLEQLVSSFIHAAVVHPVPMCWVPCDHWPIRSWPLYRARQVMREVLSNQTRGATT